MNEDKSYEPVKIPDVKCIGETANGALIVIVSGRRVFIPKTLVDDDSEVYKADTDGDLIIPEWLAIEKKIDGEVSR